MSLGFYNGETSLNLLASYRQQPISIFSIVFGKNVCCTVTLYSLYQFQRIRAIGDIT